MTAGINDKFSDTYNAANPNVARVTSTRAAAGTSLSCDSLAGWPTSTVVQFSTYKINTSNVVISNTQIDWAGIVSGNTIGTLTRITGAADSGSAVGDVVEMNPTGNWGHQLITGLLVEHNQNGTHGAITSTNATLTTPTITSGKIVTALNDTNGNGLLLPSATASAVNQFTVANAAATNAPTLSATGSDTNIDIKLSPKGTGQVKIGTSPVLAGAPTTLANAGTGGGTMYYVNLAGIKMCWGKTASQPVGTGGTTYTVTLPGSFFSTIQSSVVTEDVIGTSITQNVYVSSITTSTLTIGAWSSTNGSSQINSFFIVGT